MPDAVNAFVGLGANLAEPATQVQRAFGELSALPETALVRRSSLYLSQAVGGPAQPDFVNAVAWLRTGLSARELLDACLEIERRHGRRRDYKNAPRTLDLDLLLYDELCVHEAGLTLPHPRMHERAFVLVPLTEIAPDCAVTGHGPAGALLAGLECVAVTRLVAVPRDAAVG
jgi:2-amino-4-hydroxy-6-hydroxymethyldihydropteridine diphosphokinase